MVNGPALRIAVLSPVSWRTPPVHYGPWELFASTLTEGLVARGHEVTLFASANSITTATLAAVVPVGTSEDPTIDPKVAECTHIASLFERAAEFDIIHNNFDFLPLTYSRLVDTPMVTTIHGFSSPRIVPVYERYNDRSAYVAISDANRHPALTYAATIHHGIDTGRFGLHPAPAATLLFFGRIHPDKGTHVAIEVAKRSGRPLLIAGIIQDEAYFERLVRPHIDGVDVTFVGAVAAQDCADLLGGAAALLHLIDFEEPFGFSVAEAQACGTPVIAFDRGSMRELIQHGRTGFVVDGVDAAVSAVDSLASLDRTYIRKYALLRFDVNRMIAQYVAVYRLLLEHGLETFRATGTRVQPTRRHRGNESL